MPWFAVLVILTYLIYLHILRVHLAVLSFLYNRYLPETNTNWGERIN